MCLIVFAYREHPCYPLILVSNRDEYHARPTARAAFWNDVPGLLAGRDLEGGGTWLGLNDRGQIAAVTNYREPAPPVAEIQSRGSLAVEYLSNACTPEEYGRSAVAGGTDHAGFNLLLADSHTMTWTSNRSEEIRTLTPGVYGLSNHLLDTAWPKLTAGKSRLSTVLDARDIRAEDLLDLLNDRTIPPDEELPDTGVGLVKERMLGAAFIVDPVYGTRSTTAVVIGDDGRATLGERRYDTRGEAIGEKLFTLEVGPWGR